MPSKKDKKYARENGGISAAVTKQAATKLSRRDFSPGDDSSASRNRNGSNAVSAASSSPDFAPDTGPPTLDYGPQSSFSPLLDALSTTSASPETAPSTTNEWAKSVIAGSPSNLVNLASESPPTQPSSYEDSARLHSGWPAAHRPYMSPSPASLSPPSGGRRPLSFHLDAQHNLPGIPSRSASAAFRRTSIHSPYAASQTATPRYPPLPHHPQSHFYGIQDLDSTITPQSGMKAGEHGLFLGFDERPSQHTSSPRAEQVVLTGYQGGLLVYAVAKKGIELVASLKGLRGGVHHAKILPWTVADQQPSIYPLVAVVIHGPVLPPRSAEKPEARLGSVDSAPSDDCTNLPHSYAQTEPFAPQRLPPIKFYQTSVEVYSLATGRLVDVLLEAPKVPVNTEISISSPLFRPPPPSGAFHVKADAGTIAICSGVTGECWIYRQLMELQNGHMFACSAKVWTTLQQSQRADVVEEVDKMGSPSVPVSAAPTGASAVSRSSSQTAIFALNGRWIAYCPSKPSSQVPLRAHLPVPTLGRAPGALSMAPPHLPTSSTAVDLPIGDSMMNKFMRERTQDLISGVKWVGQQGFQAWSSYWNQQSNEKSQQPQSRSPPTQWMSSGTTQTGASQFPPTHGASAPASTGTAKDPGLVSVVDIETLPASATIHPIATFTTPLGCSFLSFSPSSMALFTASVKGDVQTVWDLLRLQHTSSSPLQSTLSHHETIGPQVRQVAQFSRMTVTRITAVAWTRPYGERLAMVTERGTIHLLNMPPSSLVWPPPRRRKMVRKPSAEASEPTTSAVSIASGAIGAAYQAAKPFVSRPRRASNTTSSVASASTLRDSAAQGGRVIAASISHSLGKTGTAISQLRHTGDNRVSLPPSTNLPSAGCVSWCRGRRSHSLFSVGGGIIRVFSCKPRAQSSSTGRRPSRTNKYHDIKVPLLPEDTVAPLLRQMMELGAADEYLEFSEADMEAGQTLMLRPSRAATGPAHDVDGTIPQAEIEFSAPYQPFHTDRRVTLCEYGRLESMSVLLASPSVDRRGAAASKRKGVQKAGASLPEAAQATAWAFGQDTAYVELDAGFPPSNEEDFIGPDDHMALPQSAMERVLQLGDAEQIVVTTRRRRSARQSDADGDGFFEDDCEVLDFADQRV